MLKLKNKKMKKLKAEVSKNLGSTYHGTLDFSEMLFSDVKNNTKIDLNDDEIIDVTCEIHNKYRKKLSNIFMNAFKKKYIKAFKKYGIDIHGVDFWTPKTYNYNSDKVFLEFDYKEKDIIDFCEKNKDQLKEYIKKIKVKSCDGYISFEPDSFSEIIKGVKNGKNAVFYSIFWVVEQKEKLQKELKNIKFIARDGACETYYNLFWSEVNK